MPLTNTELKNLKSFRLPDKRNRVGFLAEGVRVLEESVRHRFAAKTVLVCEEQLSDRGKTLAGRLQKLGASVQAIPSRQIDALSDAETSQGIVAVFDYRPTEIAELSGAVGRKVLVCDDISDPGNLGTLFRSALAFGFVSVVVLGDSADPFSPKTVRASAGAIFGLRIIQTMPEEFLSWSTKSQAGLIVTEAKGEPLGEIRRKHRSQQTICLAIGSEARGVSAALRRAATAVVGIEHDPVVESLNAAVAGSILMKGIYDLWQVHRK